MISNNDKKKLEDVKNGLKAIEANVSKLSFVYKVASNLFRLVDSLENINLKSDIKGELAKIMQTQYTEEIQQSLKSIIVFISEVEKEVDEEKKFFQDAIIKRNDDYIKDCDKYSSYRKNIEEVEKRIINSETYQDKLHEKIKRGEKWKKHYHARLTENLRIMYKLDPAKKLLLFERIITKNELEKD